MADVGLRRSQRIRLCQNTLIGVLLIVGLGALAVWLHRYLAGLSNPVPMIASFSFLLALSCWHDTKAGGRSRLTAASMALQVWLFALSSLAAPVFRARFLAFLHDIAASPQVITLFGAEYHKALSTPIVGYGACFTLSLALGRWLVIPTARRVLFSIVLDAHERVASCPHCGARMAH
jgi:hypothetical protein